MQKIYTFNFLLFSIKTISSADQACKFGILPITFLNNSKISAYDKNSVQPKQPQQKQLQRPVYSNTVVDTNNPTNTYILRDIGNSSELNNYSLFVTLNCKQEIVADFTLKNICFCPVSVDLKNLSGFSSFNLAVVAKNPR